MTTQSFRFYYLFHTNCKHQLIGMKVQFVQEAQPFREELHRLNLKIKLSLISEGEKQFPHKFTFSFEAQRGPGIGCEFSVLARFEDRLDEHLSGEVWAELIFL